MIFLQAISEVAAEGADKQGDSFWFYLELVIIIGVILYQLIHSFLVSFSINKLRKIFDFRLLIRNGYIEKFKLGNIDDDSTEIQYKDEFAEESLSEIIGADIVKLSLVDTQSKNEILLRIKKTINTYLINNYGAVVNFSIIKDIIDREVEVKDEEITQTITTPLYFGLAATMIGIIFGLLAMPRLDGEGFSDGVNALIRGVKWAMTASLFGLTCTTILSSFFYKNAKSKVLQEKNEQLSYLQAKLLPELIKAEDTGVSGLKASLDRFARVATNISDNVLIASNQTGENLILQQEIISKVENIGVLKLSKTNLELFDKLDRNRDAFEKFSTYLANMEKISSNLLDFAKRTSNIDSVVKGINTTLEDSKQLSKFLSVHFDKIEAAGSAALKSVGLTESHFEDAIESLKARTDEMINQLYKSAGNHEIKLEDIYKEVEKSISIVTSKYIDEFSEAYSNSIPKFENLENLSILPTIRDEISLHANEIHNGSNFNSQRLIDSINELNSSLQELQKNSNNQAMVMRLEAIDERLKSRVNKTEVSSSSQNRSNGTFNNSEMNDLVDQPLGIIKVMKKLFKST
jgi:hypothetical protein